MKNPDLVKAFRAARVLIRSGHQAYICYAIDRAYARGQITDATHVAAKKIVVERLGRSTYAGWVREHHPKVYQEMTQQEGAFNEGRLQWLDSLTE